MKKKASIDRDQIIILRKKPQGRGKSRHWHGFVFDTSDKNDVTTFVIELGHCYEDFIWLRGEHVTVDDQFPYHLMYKGFWIFGLDVKVKRLKRGRQFILS